MANETPQDGLSRRDLLRRLLKFVVAVAGGALGGAVAGREPLIERVKSLESSLEEAEGLGILNLFTDPNYTENIPSDRAFERLEKSIAVVRVGNEWSTGVLIGNYVLCTHHGIESILKGKDGSSDILSDPIKDEVVMNRGETYFFRIAAYSNEDDLALLKTYHRNYMWPAFVSGGNVNLKAGREIRVMASRPDFKRYLQIGRIAQVNATLNDRERKISYQNRWVADTYAKEGMSGGILTEPSGSFLGLVQGRLTETGHAYGVGWNIIHPFLMKAATLESKRLFGDKV